MPTTYVNLIPLERREIRRCHRRMRFWIGACAFFALVWLTLFLVAQATWVGDDRALRRDLDQTNELVVQEEAAVTALRDELTQSNAELAAYLAVGKQPDWSVLLALLSTTIGDQVVLQNCKLAPTPESPATFTQAMPTDRRSGSATSPSNQQPIIQLDLSGIGLSQHAVSQFVLRLEQTTLFREVTLTSTRREPYLAGHGVAFGLECVLSTDRETAR